jgi:eukaryotic-like serine/threonine-protein kinase
MFAAEVETLRPRPATVTFGPFLYDRANGLLRNSDREILLPPRVLAVLDVLISKAGEIVPKQALIESVWKDAFVTDTSLAEAVSVLRQALGDDPQSPTYIQTMHRRGYRFVAPVTVATAPAESPAAPVLDPAREERVSPSIGRELVPWGVAVLCAVLAITALWQYTHVPRSIAPVVRLPIDPVPGTFFDNRSPALTLSPDGSVVAWSACDAVCRLYVRRIDQLESRAIAGTEGAAGPFFSPDGRSIGFFSGGALRKVALAGGMPVTITDASQPYGAVWMPDGHIVFAASAFGGLLRVSDRGGDPEPLTAPAVGSGELRHAWPSLAPGGKGLLFSVATSPLDASAGRVAIMPLAQRAAGWQTILESADRAQAAVPGYVVFSRGTELHAAGFDAARQRAAGGEQVVVTGAARGQYAIAPLGAMVYAASEAPASPSLGWTDGATRTALPAGLAGLQQAVLSADGSRVAGVVGTDVWVGDLTRGTTTRLTHGGINASPVWSADGGSVLLAASRGGAFEVWTRDASGSAAPILIRSAAARQRHVFPSSVSRDGRFIAYTESGGPTRADVVVAARDDQRTIAAVQTSFDESNGTLSPDGRLIAYQSDESGRWEIYVLNIAGQRGADQRRLSVSSSGGSDPSWSSDGASLSYRTGDALLRVAIGSDGTIGSPVRIATVHEADVVGRTSDSRLLVRHAGALPLRHAVLTLEWARELRAMLGPPAAALPR